MNPAVGGIARTEAGLWLSSARWYLRSQNVEKALRRMQLAAAYLRVAALETVTFIELEEERTK